MSSGPSPLRAFERQAGRHRAIDVRELVRFDVTVRHAGTDEGAQIGRDLLFEIQAHAAAAAILAHGGDIGGTAGDLRQCDRIREGSHASAAKKSGHGDLAGMSPQLVAALDFADPLELIECRIEFEVIGKD